MAYSPLVTIKAAYSNLPSIKAAYSTLAAIKAAYSTQVAIKAAYSTLAAKKDTATNPTSDKRHNCQLAKNGIMQRTSKCVEHNNATNVIMKQIQ